MNVGLIGAGSIGGIHAAACRNAGLSIKAVSDIDPQAFDKWSDHYPGATYYPRWEELLADSRIEAVIIAVANRFHLEILRGSVSARKHIFCEKTLSESEPQAREAYALLKDYERNFQIGYMKRFFPATRKAMELLPEIGAITSARLRSHQGGEHPADIYQNPGWMPREGKPSAARQFGRGMLNMAGSHLLDLMGLLLGIPERAWATSWSAPNYDADVETHILFRMKNGAAVHFEAVLSPFSRTGYFHDGWDEVIEISGTRGQLQMYFVTWNRPMEAAPVVRLYLEPERKWQTFSFPRVNPFELELSSFRKNCLEGSRSRPGIEEAYWVDCWLDGCYSSAESGAPVNFPSILP